MIWILLSILSGLGDATMFALIKKFKGINNLILVWVQHSFALPFLLVILYFNFPQKINMIVYWLAILNGMLLLITTYLLVKAAQIGELSITMPMLSLTPLFLILTSYLMINELPTFYGIAGILLIVLGTYVINVKNFKKGFAKPFYSLFKNKGSFYVVIVAFIWSITANFFKIGILNSNPIFFTTIVHLIITLFILPLFFIKFGEKVNELKTNFNKLFLLGVASAFMSATGAYAMLTAIVPYFISLKRSGVIFSIFFGYFMFNEKNLKNALIGTIIMIVGGVLIVFKY